MQTTSFVDSAAIGGLELDSVTTAKCNSWPLPTHNRGVMCQAIGLRHGLQEKFLEKFDFRQVRKGLAILSINLTPDFCSLAKVAQ